MTERCPCHRERWVSLEGWTPDPHRPGYLMDPTRPGWARDLQGRWCSQLDLDNAAAAVEEAAVQAELVTGDLDSELDAIRRVRRAAKEVLGR